MEAGVSLTFLSALRILFLLMGYLVQPRYEDFCIVLVYRVFSCLVVVSRRSAPF